MFVLYSIKFYGGKAGRQVPKCSSPFFQATEEERPASLLQSPFGCCFCLFVCFSSVAASPIAKESFQGPDHGRKK